MENNEIIVEVFKLSVGNISRVAAITKINGYHYSIHKNLNTPFTNEEFTAAKDFVMFKIALKITQG